MTSDIASFRLPGASQSCSTSADRPGCRSSTIHSTGPRPSRALPISAQGRDGGCRAGGRVELAEVEAHARRHAGELLREQHLHRGLVDLHVAALGVAVALDPHDAAGPGRRVALCVLQHQHRLAGARQAVDHGGIADCLLLPRQRVSGEQLVQLPELAQPAGEAHGGSLAFRKPVHRGLDDLAEDRVVGSPHGADDAVDEGSPGGVVGDGWARRDAGVLQRCAREVCTVGFRVDRNDPFHLAIDACGGGELPTACLTSRVHRRVPHDERRRVGERGTRCR